MIVGQVVRTKTHTWDLDGERESVGRPNVVDTPDGLERHVFPGDLAEVVRVHENRAELVFRSNGCWVVFDRDEYDQLEVVG